MQKFSSNMFNILLKFLHILPRSPLFSLRNLTHQQTLITLILLILAPVLAYAQLQTSLSNSVMQLTAVTKQKKDKTLHYRIQVAYPHIASSQYASSAQKFNTMIQEDIQKRIQAFSDQVTQRRAEQTTLPHMLANNYLIINYEADSIHPNNTFIVSVRFKTETYFSGMAHPTHVHSVINYNLNTGKTLTLKEIFLPHAKYLPIIATYCEKVLQKTLPKQAFFTAGVAPTIGNYDLWNLHADGLVITFDEYQVAPYAFGPQMVTIPYSELKGLLSPMLLS